MTRAPDQAFLEFVKSRAAPLHRMAFLPRSSQEA
jgi:hypothetical protein